MGPFGEYLQKLSTPQTQKELDVLNEKPMVFPGKLNPDYLDKYLIEPIKSAIAEDRCYYIKQLHNGLHLFSISEKFNKIYFLSDEEKLVGGTLVEAKSSKEDGYYQFKVTKKLDESLKGMLIDLYREASLDLKDYVFSDNLQSISSSTIWRNRNSEFLADSSISSSKSGISLFGNLGSISSTFYEQLLCQ